MGNYICNAAIIYDARSLWFDETFLEDLLFSTNLMRHIANRAAN